MYLLEFIPTKNWVDLNKWVSHQQKRLSPIQSGIPKSLWEKNNLESIDDWFIKALIVFCCWFVRVYLGVYFVFLINNLGISTISGSFPIQSGILKKSNGKKLKLEAM